MWYKPPKVSVFVTQSRGTHHQLLIVIPVETKTDKFYCKVYEDNPVEIEVVKSHKLRPQAKHLNVKL